MAGWDRRHTEPPGRRGPSVPNKANFPAYPAESGGPKDVKQTQFRCFGPENKGGRAKQSQFAGPGKRGAEREKSQTRNGEGGSGALPFGGLHR